MSDATTNGTSAFAGFRKIGQRLSGGVVWVAMWNPETKSRIEVPVEDYEYQYGDGPFVAPAVAEYGLGELERLHDADIDDDALRDFNIHEGVVFKGAEVRVDRGRKVPVGTVGVVSRIRDVHDRYGRPVATYADIVSEDGSRHSTSIENLVVLG